MEGLEYKMFFGQEENGFTPTIAFLIELFNGQINDCVDNHIESQKLLFGEYYALIQRDKFITLKNLIGERIITINMAFPEKPLRQVIYFFPEENNKVIAIACNVIPKAGNAYDEIFDKSIETFEWTNSVTINEKRYFYEESLGIFLTPPEPWLENKFPNQSYKTIVLGQRVEPNNPIIFFSLQVYNGDLNTSTDYLIESLKNRLGNNFNIIYRSIFTLQNNLKGEKLIFLMSQNEQTVRQVAYRFSRKNNEILSIICVISAEAGDSYDEIFDKIIDTLEWID